MKMITTAECENCEYGEIDDSNKKKIIVLCKVRNKKYIYGQRVPCEDMNKRKND